MSNEESKAINTLDGEFGRDRLARLLIAEPATFNDVIQFVQESTSGNAQSDDITMVIIEIE